MRMKNWAAPLLALVLVPFLACGGGDRSPTAIPVPEATPKPAPTPTPEAAANPAPANEATEPDFAGTLSDENGLCNAEVVNKSKRVWTGHLAAWANTEPSNAPATQWNMSELDGIRIPNDGKKYEFSVTKDSCDTQCDMSPLSKAPNSAADYTALLMHKHFKGIICPRPSNTTPTPKPSPPGCVSHNVEGNVPEAATLSQDGRTAVIAFSYDWNKSGPATMQLKLMRGTSLLETLTVSRKQVVERTYNTEQASFSIKIIHELDECNKSSDQFTVPSGPPPTLNCDGLKPFTCSGRVEEHQGDPIHAFVKAKAAWVGSPDCVSIKIGGFPAFKYCHNDAEVPSDGLSVEKPKGPPGENIAIVATANLSGISPADSSRSDQCTATCTVHINPRTDFCVLSPNGGYSALGVTSLEADGRVHAQWAGYVTGVLECHDGDKAIAHLKNNTDVLQTVQVRRADNGQIVYGGPSGKLIPAGGADSFFGPNTILNIFVWTGSKWDFSAGIRATDVQCPCVIDPSR